jgi:hypothetical protein
MREWIQIRWWGIVNGVRQYREYRSYGYGLIGAFTAAYRMGRFKYRLVNFEAYCRWRKEMGQPLL